MNGQLLKDYRARKSLTQVEAANRLQCSQDYISKVERGERGYPDGYLEVQRWANELGVSPEDLLGKKVTAA